MPIVLTDLAKTLSEQTNIQVSIILEIDGFDYKFGSITLEEELNFDLDAETFDSGLLFDTNISDPDSRAWVNLEGTTKNITSQLSIDKGIESVKSFTVDLLDKDGELSQIFTPGHTVEDVLGQRAKVYLGFKGGLHPVDSLLIMEGVIGQYTFTGKGTCKVVIDHATQLKRQEIFVAHKTKLDGALASGATSIDVVDGSGFIVPDPASPELLPHVRIGDEIIQYYTISGNTLTFCGRERLGTTQPVSHDDGTEVTSFYRLGGNAIDLALKLMLSGGGYALEKSVTSFGILSTTSTIANSILIDTPDIETEYGLVYGDYVQITGSDSNDMTTQIIDFGKVNETQSYIITIDNLVNEDEQTATVKFKSQYDKLSEGAGMLPTQVDVARHEYWLDLFSSNFPLMAFSFEDSIQIDEFINKELYRPCNLYSTPGAKASVKMTIPPLSDIYTKTLNESNVVNPSKISVKRSLNSYHYNTVVYKYNPNVLDLSTYLNGKVVMNNDSLTRIGVGKKVLKINSQGFKDDTDTSNALTIGATRFLDRYKFAAESFSVETFFSTGSAIECGDIVVVDGLNIYDSTSGTRDFTPKQFEVINKSISIGSAKIKLDLLSTSYGLNGRYGVISPASKIDSGATTTNIPLKLSYGNTTKEYSKWENHIGATVRIHNEDWTFNETTVITGFDPGSENTAICSPALSAPPAEDYIFDSPTYDDGSGDTLLTMKDMYCFITPKLTVTGVTDSTIFEVSVSDAAKLFAGASIEVHNSTYTSADEGTIDSVVGTTVTLKSALSYTPNINDEIDLIGFVGDSGKPYRIL